ncbi:50S ribosomal protein L19, chloroplastic [Melia azedarach]|uniref:50S ribosomal protein L19, chloroplastic n=1 Tax=Melia azedarach TaxID=155640 RepID=A0ACC1XLN1_MELAZ|nr:50S ribosomal protein L19, chloroplastic [Melia azedarach]
MQSFRGSIRLIQRHTLTSANAISLPNGVVSSKSIGHSFDSMKNCLVRSLHLVASRSQVKFGSQTESLASLNYYGRSTSGLNELAMLEPHISNRCITTAGGSVESPSQAPSAAFSDVAPRIKFKRLDKTARNIMQILDKEAVEEVKSHREIPDIKPGYIVQLKVEVPENKRRVSIVKGIVIARRNAGINTTFRLRRLVAGVGVESLFPLYSPNIKEIKVLDKKKVRRAKLYYLRDRMNPLRNK